MPPIRGLRIPFAFLITLLLAPASLRADDAPKTASAAKSSATATATTTVKSADPTKFHGADAVQALPKYVRPAAYSEDMAIDSKGQKMTMRTYVDGTKRRTEMNAMGHAMVTIQPDDSGAIYTLMPEQKRAIKYTMDAKDLAPTANATGGDTLGSVPADFEVEDLGVDKLGDIAAKKFRITTAEGSVLSWFDPTSGAPLRMESTYDGEPALIEWSNRSAGPQSAELFEVPKGYEVTDMSAAMAGMGGMGGMGAMAKGMGAGMVGGMAQGFGGGLGSSIGGMLGGPLGAVAGQYIGGKIGNAVAKKATDAIVH